MVGDVQGQQDCPSGPNRGRKYRSRASFSLELAVEYFAALR
jgi:hypothetical protein